MEKLEPIVLAAALVLWIGGAALFKYLAAREVARSEGQDVLPVLAWTGWLKGRTRRARVLRNVTFVWIVVGFAVLATLAQVFQE
jgi:hypothetical protein